MKLLFILIYFLCISFYSIALPTQLNDFIGESLKYQVTWFGLDAAEGSIQVRSVIFNNRPAIQVHAFIHSARWFASIYYVEDSIVSLLDPKSMLPLKISVDYREGEKYERKTDYLFDYKEHKVISTRSKDQGKALALPPNVMDMFGGFFLLRMTDFSKNDTLTRQVVDGRKIYKVETKLTSMRKLETLQGDKECLELHPNRINLELEGKQQKAREVSIFLTNDSDRIPVLAKGKIGLGSLVAKLVDYQKKKAR